MRAPAEPRSMMVVPSWVEAHCAVPDGFRRGEPLRLYDDQLTFFAEFYKVRPGVPWVPDNPILAPAFIHRRGFVVGPQKLGKNPMGAAWACGEAEGPVVFAGFAGRDQGYACTDWGCGCSWEYEYDVGEPMGMPWPSPLIQITAYSEAQTDNTWSVLRPMIALGPLADLIPSRGESVIRLRGSESGDDPPRIETVTSSSLSRLGARTTAVLQDQLESWTPSTGMDDVADAQYRNLAGVGGRALGLANAWDPTQHSVAQREWENGEVDVYRQSIWALGHEQLPCRDEEHEHFADVAERRLILEHVYPLDHRREGGGHVDLDSIEAEARAIAAYDLPQARRWYGNEIVEGSGKAFDITTWNDRRRERDYVPPAGSIITLGIDGSVRWDHFPIIATEVASGYQWPLRIWTPGGPGLEVDVRQVDAVLEDAFSTWAVWRLYGDPPYIESWLAKWAGQYGDDRIVKWETARIRAMAYALRAYRQAIASGELTHCAKTHPWCALFSEHVGNAVRNDTGYRDDEGLLWTVQKDRDGSPRKIDSVPAGALSWQARLDCIASGAMNLEPEVSAYAGLSEEEIVARILGDD